MVPKIAYLSLMELKKIKILSHIYPNKNLILRQPEGKKKDNTLF